MFSKQSDEWVTPQDVYDALDAEFRFAVDVAATNENTKAPFHFGPGSHVSDALLSETWGLDGWIEAGDEYGAPVFWCNPPYSKCREFVAKAAWEASEGCTVVCLVPSRTDTRWLHDHVWDRDRHQPQPGVEVRFLKGRLKFSGAKAGAPFPSMIVVFRPPHA